MQAWEEKIIEHQRAREAGLAEGRAEGLAMGLAEGRAEGCAVGEMLKLVTMVRKKKDKDWTVERIAEVFEEQEAVVGVIMEYLARYPDYTDEQIQQLWSSKVQTP